MRLGLIISFLLFSQLLLAQTSLEQVRINYVKAVSDKELCKRMMDELKGRESESLYLGYLGGFQAIWANHVGNPFSKLKTFNKGKANIEKAVKQEGNLTELRYIRLSIQKNVPSILGYSDKIEVDKSFLKLHKSSITSSFLLANIESLLKD